MDWKTLACGVALSGAGLLGCGDDDGVAPPTDDDAGMAGAEDAGPPPVDAFMMMPGDDVDCSGDSCFFVANSLSVASEQEGGIAEGFNLDGLVSTMMDEAGCFQDDFTSPSGVPGIDNQLAVLGPVLASAAMIDLDGSIASAVTDGSIVVLMELEDFENENDSDLTLNVLIGALPCDDTCADEAEPMCVSAGKTFDINAASFMGEMPVVSVSGSAVAIAGGSRITAGPLDLALSVPIDGDTTVNLAIRDAQIVFDRSDDGTMLSNGIIGGSLNIDELSETVSQVAPEVDIGTALTILESLTDLEPDESDVCQNLSLALNFGAVGAVRGEVREVDACAAP